MPKNKRKINGVAETDPLKTKRLKSSQQAAQVPVHLSSGNGVGKVPRELVDLTQEHELNEDIDGSWEQVIRQKATQGLIDKAKQVEGYYSNDDVTILLDGLLRRAGFVRVRGGAKQDMLKNLRTGRIKKTMVLAPMAEDSKEAVNRLAEDIIRACSNKIKQILIPINIPNIHWYTLQLHIFPTPISYSLVATIHDSLGIRKNSVILEELLVLGVPLIKSVEGVLPKIQLSESGGNKNVYCGGYTARLITNLALHSRLATKEMWGGSDDRDYILRQEDVQTVNEYNPINAKNFGKEVINEAVIMQAADNMSLIRDVIAKEKQYKLLKEFEKIYPLLITQTKEIIKSINIPAEPALIAVLARELYEILPYLFKGLFKLNALGDIEEDALGRLKLDTTIEIEQIRNIIIEFQKKFFSLEGIEAEQIVEAQPNKDIDYLRYVLAKQNLAMWQAVHQGNPNAASVLNDVGLAYQHYVTKALYYLEDDLAKKRALYADNNRAIVKIFNGLGAESQNYVNCMLQLNMIDKAKLYTAQQNQAEEFKGQGTLPHVTSNYPEYYNSGLDHVLELRLTSLGFMLDSKLVLLKSRYSTEKLEPSAKQLVKDVTLKISSDNSEIILSPFNLYNKHWLGLLFKNLGEVIEVIYMDSEQRTMMPAFKKELEHSFALNGYQSKFLELKLEQQRYNNCGSELLENFVYYLTGARATQEMAIHVHSLLFENSLLDPKEYGLKIAENNKLIRFLSNTAPLPIRSMEAFLIAQRHLHHASSQRKLGSSSFSSESRRKPSSGLTRGSSPQYQISIREDGSSGQARRKGLDPSFRWDDAGGGVDAIDLNLLPAVEQFNRFWTKWVQDKIIQVNSVIYKTTLGFKGLDLMVDSARLVYEPEIDNAKKVVYDVSHLYGMVVGVNCYSVLVSGADVAYQLQLGEYQKACDVAIGAGSAMALPVILAMLNRPHLGFVYSMWVAASTAYNAIENAYSFALELTEESQATGFEFMAGQVVGHEDRDS
jgi:hypothetical protein